MKIYSYLEVRQPIGVFYFCCIPATELTQIVETRTRGLDEGGVQRERTNKRIKDIAFYCSDPDAVFPTPIVVSVDKDANVEIDEEAHTIKIKEEGVIGDVIDGQHRLWGIKEARNIEDFILPVVFMFNLTTEEKAYVFSTINSNQTKVSPSLIYDLFDVSKQRSPQRTAHEIARALNSSEESPFYNRLKMLGKKELSQENATLSQGTFVKSLIELISLDPQKDYVILKKGGKLVADSRCPFRDMFIKGRDNIIMKVLINCFGALKEVFPEEWENPNSNILWKTTGFRGVIYSLRSILAKGYREHDMTRAFFVSCFTIFKDYLKKSDIDLTSRSFPGGGEQNQKKFARLVAESVALKTPEAYHGSMRQEHDLESFITHVGNISSTELYDLACALKNGETKFGSFKIEDKDGWLRLLLYRADMAVDIEKDRRDDLLAWLQRRYMAGLDAESWFKNMEDE